MMYRINRLRSCLLLLMTSLLYPNLGHSGGQAPFKAAEFGFYGNGNTSWAALYDNENSVSSKRVDMPPLPTVVKQLIFANTTFNPFKVPYAYLYTPQYQRALQRCDSTGMPFELDDNPKTQEWVAATFFLRCFSGQDYNPIRPAHFWIIQQDAQKRSRVLIEGDDSITNKTKTTQDQGGYRSIHTQHYVVNFDPQENQKEEGCGSIMMQWHYNGKQYRILEQVGEEFVDDCRDTMQNDFDLFSDEEMMERRQQAQVRVKAVVDRWLPKLRGFR